MYLEFVCYIIFAIKLFRWDPAALVPLSKLSVVKIIFVLSILMEPKKRAQIEASKV